MAWEIINGDANSILKNYITPGAVIVTDPPFNIGYHYKTYKDKMRESEYMDLIGGGDKTSAFRNNPLS